MLQFGDGVRRPHVFLSAHAPGVFAASVERTCQHRVVAERRAMRADGLFGDAEQADAFNVRASASEIFIHQNFGETHRFENLRAGVRHIGRDAHFGHHFAQALAHGLDEILDGFFAINIRAKLLAFGELQQRFQRQIWMYRFRTIAAEQGEVMHLARAAGFHHQPGAGAQALVRQMLMNRRQRQQRGNRHVVAVHLTVGNNNDRKAAAHGVFGLCRKAGQTRFDGLVAPGQRIGDIEFARLEFAIGVTVDVTDFLHLVKIDHRLADFQPNRRIGFVDAQQVGLRADERHQRGHQFLADRINRRVGHLREQLFEVMI